MRILPNLIHLRAFEAVARHLNISKAGDELFVTHSAVSQQVKALEEDLGVSLINRTGHKIKLTAAGQEYAESIISIFNRLRQVSKKIRSTKNQSIIRLGVPNTLGLKCLIPKLGLFYDTYPDSEIQLLIFHDQNEPDDVDIEISYGERQGIDADMILTEDRLVAIKAPFYKAVIDQARLLKVTSPMRQQDWPQWLTAANLTLDTSNMISFHETLQAIQAAENGLGIFVTHEIFIREDLKQNKLCLANPLTIPTEKVFYLKANDDIKNSPRFQEIKAWLRDGVFNH
jgi:DNA-binding transcriptional LysR family regulator